MTLTTTLLVQLLGECQFAEWEVAGSNPSQTNTLGLHITKKKMLPL